MYANIQATTCAVQTIFVDMVVKRRIKALNDRHKPIDFSTILCPPVHNVEAGYVCDCLCVNIKESLEELLRNVSESHTKLTAAN